MPSQPLNSFHERSNSTIVHMHPPARVGGLWLHPIRTCHVATVTSAPDPMQPDTRQFSSSNERLPLFQPIQTSN
ncbi:hypothetical protein L484_003867 [Morus notabilis]|uniref:Uncharacterized protein n=1 Tax=Morus notabilis TaxID=981085 RepID=W9RRW1_9ROSA|nr:hypothetical protein L484_003867 [Morus notabilis]